MRLIGQRASSAQPATLASPALLPLPQISPKTVYNVIFGVSRWCHLCFYICTTLKFYAVPCRPSCLFVAVAVMEINAGIVCIVLALLCAYALGGSATKAYALKLLKFLQKMCKPSDEEDMIEVCTWRKAGEKVHLSETCGGQGLRDQWRLPRRFLLNKKFLKVEWCKKCATQYIV